MDEGIAFDLEDAAEAKAGELLGPSVLVWKDSAFKKKDGSDESEAPRFCADTIGRALASLISPEPAPATSGRLSAYASDFAVTSRVFTKLLEAAVTAVEETGDTSPVSDALLTVVSSFLTTRLEDEAALAAAVTRSEEHTSELQSLIR